MVISFSFKQHITWHQLILATQQIAPWQVIGAERVGGVRERLLGTADFCPVAAAVVEGRNGD
ncbi:MAG: hypothetical protein BGO13_08735 [Burkholderiales bacterium 66-5]|nr:MAG: hypothetical protein BGO13_08735 [Burkholderiales bacterium 66-5]